MGKTRVVEQVSIYIIYLIFKLRYSSQSVIDTKDIDIFKMATMLIQNASEFVKITSKYYQ